MLKTTKKLSWRVNREDFEKMMKKGGFSNSGLFSLRFLKNPLNSSHPPERPDVGSSGRAGFSVVVSKKVAKTAVSRNKIRRRCYSILRKLIKKPLPAAILQNPSGEFGRASFIALFAKKGVEKATFQEFQADIEKLLEKAKIYVSR